jgi:Lrp/AsnC family leucine-responsive transcriptional regulator
MDAIDSEIIGILRSDGRISFRALGDSVGLSTSAAAARVHKLESDGTIVGYQAVIAGHSNPPTSGLEAFIDVRLGTDTTYESFLGRIEHLREIRDAIHMTGPYDYLLHIQVVDTAHLDRFLRALKSEAGAAQTQTRIALRQT